MGHLQTFKLRSTPTDLAGHITAADLRAAHGWTPAQLSAARACGLMPPRIRHSVPIVGDPRIEHWYRDDAVRAWAQDLAVVAPGVLAAPAASFTAHGSYVLLDVVMQTFSWGEAHLTAARRLLFPCTTWRTRQDGRRDESLRTHEVDGWANLIRTVTRVEVPA